MKTFLIVILAFLAYLIWYSIVQWLLPAADGLIFLGGIIIGMVATQYWINS